MPKFDFEKIKFAVQHNGYLWFENGNYNLNIVGIRSFNPQKKITDLFDDYLCVCYYLDNKPVYHEFNITTKPGIKGAVEHRNPKGVALLKEGQYKGLWSIGLHQNKIKALVQTGTCVVIRDGNKNTIFDGTKLDSGLFGINCHPATPNIVTKRVANWSEGCQVFADWNKFYNEFIPLCEKSKELYGNRFTYTLLKEEQMN